MREPLYNDRARLRAANFLPSEQRMKQLTRAVLYLTIIAILAATLFPTGSTLVRQPLAHCLACGERGVAEAIANLLLFLPLGVSVALLHGARNGAWLTALLFSTGIEVTQGFIPGRYTSLSDVLLNTAGAMLGAAIVRSARWWLAPTPRISGYLSMVAAIVAAGALALSGLLLAPSFPETVYFGQWTPSLSHLQQYEGSVHGAHIGTEPIREGRLPSTRMRAALLAGVPIRISALAGAPPPELAPIVSIYDVDKREILLIGADRSDLVLRRRMRSADVLLDQPDIRAAGALKSAAPGAPLDIMVFRRDSGLCIVSNGKPTCELGFSAGSGWGLLFYVGSLPASLKRLLNVIWVAALLLPVGFWLRQRRESYIAVCIALVAFASLPAATGLLKTPVWEWIGAAAGLMTGVLVRRAISSYVAPSQQGDRQVVIPPPYVDQAGALHLRKPVDTPL